MNESTIGARTAVDANGRDGRRARAGSANLPGLDGLRGVAVAAVLAYHCGVGWATGGFLGVEMFFVLSGFLITGLLVDDVVRRGGVDLPAFYRARGRRLLPGLLVCVLGTLAAYQLLAANTGISLRGGAFAALTYTQNWHLILGEVPYSATFGPPDPFLHLWSLAVEAQLYLCWPAVVLFGLAVFGRRATAALTVALALGSAVLMSALYDPVASGRVYFGTDTRAGGFLIGAALALACVPALRRGTRPGLATVLDWAAAGSGLLLLAGLVAVSEFAEPLYGNGGFALVAVLTAVLVAAVAYPGTRVSRPLRWSPLLWLGRRSYGVYLYHWPVFALTTPGVDVPDVPVVTDVLRIALTFGLAELSYRYVEMPVRRGALSPVWAALRRRSPRARLGAGVLAGVGLVLTVVLLGGSVAPPPVAAPRPRPEPVRTVGSTRGVLVVGDSVALGSSGALTATLGADTRVDAVVGRQFDDGATIVDEWASGHPGPVVVALGSNGIARDEDVERLIDAAPDRRIVLVSVSVPRRWREPVNDVLHAAADRHDDRVRVADWAGIAAANPSLLGPDQVHPTRTGQRRLATAVRDALTGP
jgi:peptidoglycan/LPS O-acetylase OafA/YrhL